MKKFKNILNSRYDLKDDLEKYKSAWAELDRKITELERLTGLYMYEIIDLLKKGYVIKSRFHPDIMEGD